MSWGSPQILKVIGYCHWEKAMAAMVWGAHISGILHNCIILDERVHDMYIWKKCRIHDLYNVQPCLCIHGMYNDVCNPMA